METDTIFKNELDSEEFICCECGGKFNHTQGTWLPTGRLIYQDYCSILPEGTDPRFPTTPVAFFSLKPPELEYSSDFTCYDCTN